MDFPMSIISSDLFCVMGLLHSCYKNNLGKCTCLICIFLFVFVNKKSDCCFCCCCTYVLFPVCFSFSVCRVSVLGDQQIEEESCDGSVQSRWYLLRTSEMLHLPLAYLENTWMYQKMTSKTDQSVLLDAFGLFPLFMTIKSKINEQYVLNE